MRARRLGAIGCVATSMIASCVGIKLSSTEQETVTLTGGSGSGSNFSYSFGATAGSSHGFTVTAFGPTDDDYVTGIHYLNSPCAHFAINLTGGPLPQHEVCGSSVLTNGLKSAPTQKKLCTDYTFSIDFTPGFANLDTCGIVIESTPFGGNTPNPPIQLTVSGSGLSMPYALTVTPGPPPSNAINFGSVPITTQSAFQTVTVRNAGSASITVTPSSNIAGTFILPPMFFTPFTLSAGLGASKVFQIACNPPTVATNNKYVQFDTSLAEGDLHPQVALSCSGVSTSLSIAPNPIDFGVIMIGGGPADKLITVMNGSAGSAMIGSITLTTASSEVSLVPSNPGGFTVGAGSSATPVTVHYTALTERSPGALGTLVLTSGSNMLSYPITGGAQTGSIGTNPAGVNFGAVCAGTTAMQSVGVYASGTADVPISLPSSGEPALPFAASIPAGVVQGDHDGEATLTVSVTPAITDLGPLVSKVVLDTQIPNQATYTVGLKAFGVPQGLAATPTAVDFGGALVDTTTSAKEIVFSNCGGASVMVTSAEIVGADQTSFSLISPDAASIPKALGSAASESFLVVMSPHTLASQSAQLQIDYSGGSASSAIVELTGQGTRPDTDRQTYYACSTTGSGAAWPIGVALLALRRRRR